jgi:hypothetical protein
MPFPRLNVITHDPMESDYRPAVDATGRHVLFERTPRGGGITTLFITSIDAPHGPEPFIHDLGGVHISTGPSQTRPDWCWATGHVALNVAASDRSPFHVMIAEPSGIPLGNVPGSLRWIYPTWSSDGTQLVVMNGTGAGHPRTSLVSPNGTVAQANLNGNDANGGPMYGGFASPRPGNPSLIAYAGQPNAPSWSGASPAGYDQDRNYVFLNATSAATFTSAPLEPDASITQFDKSHQGRAPSWSPAGNHLAFESNRVDGRHYAIFLVNVSAGSKPVQVTDVTYDAQHAKFFPDGKSLIITAFQTPGHGPRGIAELDISGYL